MKLLKALLLILVVLLLAAGAALALFPAKTAIAWLGGRVGPLQLEEVGGTVWNGHAGRVLAHGQSLGRLSWTLSPRSLLGGAADLDLQLDGEAWKGRTRALVRGPLSAELSDLSLSFPAQLLGPAIDIPALVPSGRVELSLPRARIEGGYPRELKGEAIWREAAVAGEAAAALGDLKAEFSTTADGAITGILSDLGGPLSLEGSFRFALTGYEAEALLRPRFADSAIDRALNHVGQRQPDGSSYLSITGSLLPVR
jgi:general secretion pathway protein N